MTGFKPRISGVVSDRSTNCVATTAYPAAKFYSKTKHRNVKVDHLSPE